jgi:hypothetical protein
VPPVPQPVPRFFADASVEGLPYGRWAQQLREHFVKACEPLLAEAGGPPGEITWFPERGWGGKTYIPATARAEVSDGKPAAEYFGYVSFERRGAGAPAGIKGHADFTDILADDNADWQIDLNEEVIGKWRGEGDRAGDVTLVWGTPMIRGAIAATAELDREVADQTPVTDERFTLLALDAVKGFYDDMFLEVKLWGKKGVELAAESLYDEPE